MSAMKSLGSGSGSGCGCGYWLSENRLRKNFYMRLKTI
ncbi:hypothetical protein HMPREF9435_0831 [Gardnerella vaginalis 315-A]|nr:hypothetical protein HMPREF9435_0831 [Gardnerella vaginalis 315-A]